MKKSILLSAVAAIAGCSYAGATDYEKVILESVEGITDGNYLIVSPESAAVMGAHNGGIFDAVTLEGLSDETLTITGSDEFSVVSITKVDGGYWLKVGEQFLTQTAKNKLTVTDTETLASITYENDILKIFANPKAAIQSVATSWIQYNSQNPRFAGYSNAQKPIVLFREIETIEPADYSTGLEGTSHTHSRLTKGLTIADNAGHALNITGLQSSGDKSMIFDRTDSDILTTYPGSTVTITPDAEMSWMHKYAYVDWSKDGFAYDDPDTYLEADGYAILTGADLVAFDFFSRSDSNSGYNSKGDSGVSNNLTMNTPFSFSVPADAAPGTYRAVSYTHL
ncbi:MAG: hypothetical protein K2M97_05215, partial [Muribaculaceae bacterium]|nr:hypothetical protein [Muribaculaceae bacterium]